VQERKAWVEFGPSIMELDEVYDLAAQVDVSPREAAAIIAFAVSFGIARGDDAGNISDFTTRSIEAACFWDGERGALLEALRESRVFLGEQDSDSDPLRISPVLWEKLASRAVKGRVTSRKRQAEWRAKQASGK
jgi:hypothetical protein